MSEGVQRGNAIGSHAAAHDGQPLADVNALLAEHLAGRLVDRFLSGAGLSLSHRADAVAQTKFFVKTDSDGHRTMDVALPAGSGNPGGYRWDGSTARAEEIADHAAARGVEDVLWDRENIGPTGWEPEFDSR